MITFLYAGILGLIYVLLTYHTIKGRFQNKISLGDGNNENMLRRIRVHGNFNEYVPLILILMALAETTQQLSPFVLHILGVMLVTGRIIFSLSVAQIVLIPKGRQIGMAITLGCLIIFSIAGIIGFFF